ncbi:MAG: phosphatidate cytidylyltransferase, partial [Alphaproteobacteria bacterium]
MKGAREATAFALIPLVVAAIVFLPPWVYLALVWVVAVLSAWELLALFRRLGQPAPQAPTLVILGVLLPAVWLGGLPRTGALLALALLAVPVVYLVGRYP